MESEPGFPYWKGRNYKVGGLLVLGESAYNLEDPDCPVHPEWSVRAVLDHLAGKPEVGFERWHLHFQRIFSTVYGPEKPWNRDNAAEFYESILYANYIVPPVGGRAKDRPRKEAWDGAWPPFRSLMLWLAAANLTPNGILILGLELWGHLLKAAGEEVSGLETERETLAIAGMPSIRVCCIPHPASWPRHGFTAEATHRHFLVKLGSR